MLLSNTNEIVDKQMEEIEFVNINEEPMLPEISESLINTPHSVKTEGGESGALQYVKQEIVDEYDEAMNTHYKALEGSAIKAEGEGSIGFIPVKCEPEMCYVNSLNLHVRYSYENENQDVVRDKGEKYEPQILVKPEKLDSYDEERETLDCEDSDESHMKTKNKKAKTRKEQLQCRLCFKVFATKYSLKVHEGGHTKERPFECEICGKYFRLKPLLKQHVMRVHRNIAREACGMCGKQVKSKDALKKHMKNIHSMDDSLPVGKNEGKCAAVQHLLEQLDNINPNFASFLY